MAKKYYAVRQGYMPGVYETWPACETQVKGYSGAIYKSFTTKAEAEHFVYGEIKSLNKEVMGKGEELNRANEMIPIKKYDSHIVIAYIDGSFDKEKNVVGSGGVIFYQNKEEEFSFGSADKQYTAYWNVSGELLATMYVIRYAQKVGAKHVVLYYDYMGIEMWATGKWKANNPLTQQYASFMQHMQSEIQVEFCKVAAHTGVTYNEKADALAKKGTLKVSSEI